MLKSLNKPLLLPVPCTVVLQVALYQLFDAVKIDFDICASE